MTKYIDADLWRDLPDDLPYKGAVKRVLIQAPAADVRPVVFCGNCKFWDKKRISREGLARCLTGETGIRYRTANDYCSRGQKE